MIEWVFEEIDGLQLFEKMMNDEQVYEKMTRMLGNPQETLKAA